LPTSQEIEQRIQCTRNLFVEPLFREALGIFHDAMKVFVDGDAEMALQLKPRDRVLDSLNKEVADKFMSESRPTRAEFKSYYQSHFNRARALSAWEITRPTSGKMLFGLSSRGYSTHIREEKGRMIAVRVAKNPRAE